MTTMALESSSLTDTSLLLDKFNLTSGSRLNSISSPKTADVPVCATSNWYLLRWFR